MGITFIIGEATPKIASVKEIESGYDSAELRWTASVIRDPSIPNDASFRDFSYSGFAHVATLAGIDDIILGRGRLEVQPPLRPEHPGAARLTPKDLARFEAGLATLRAKGLGDDAHEVQALQWFVTWTRYALDHCKVATIANH